MAAFSLMWVILAALLSDLVSGRQGTAEEVLVPSYFGEAAVTRASNEAPEAPKLPILLTQANLQTLGVALKEEPVQAVPQLSNSNLEKVCESTRQALSVQVDGSNLPKGPVYKECMAALAPLRDHHQDSDAVDTLSDCMALVNALVASKGGDCHDAVLVMQAAQKPQPSSPQSAKATQLKPQVSKEAAAKQEAEALDLVSEAMSAVCTETVRDAEAGIKSEGDAMKLANAVGPICQDKALKHLGASAATTSLTKEWCHQLDGRLTIALETGFFFALSPDEAERQAAEPNPYAATTRRKFCTRFVNSLRKQAQDGDMYLNGPPPPGSKTAPAKVAPTVPVAAVEAAAVAPEKALPTLPPAPKTQPAGVPIAFGHIADQSDQQEKAASSMSVPKGTGVDMLRLVQALSMRNEWTAACTGLISRLTSEEGSVTEEYALGDHETAEGTKVLTFNAADQGQIRKCAAQLKVLAIQSGIIGNTASSGPAKKTAFLEVSTGMSLSSADDAEALMDSPWAADACADVAHGYLTAHLAHPGFEAAEFCPLYARDLQAMHSALPPAERAKQDIQQLRKRASLKRHVAQSQALPAPKQQAAQAKRPAVLITEASTVASDEDKEGMDFWADMMK